MAIDAALYSMSKCYFFKGNRYLRMTRGDTGPGLVDSGYPAPISNWGGPAGSEQAGSTRRCTPTRSAISSRATSMSA
jgi:hypothetical protein